MHGLPAGAGPVGELLEMVGLPARLADRLPAPALRRPAPARRHRPRPGRRPQVLVLDEPVSALDVSVRAEIINLLARLRDECG